MVLWIICFIALFSTSQSSRLLEDDDKIVYGADDRLDYFERAEQFGENDVFARIGRQSIVALMRSVGRPNSNGVYPIHQRGRTLGLCSGERFNDQPGVASCSGTLVSNNQVITAGHCITSQSSCRGLKFVFNFYVTGYRNGRPQYAEIRDSDIYSCTSVVTRNSNGHDWAVATLDRVVPASSGHFPIPFLTSEARARPAGEDLVMIGFPSGLPMKIEDGGSVIQPGSGSLTSFRATTDAFAGNSGSGVFTKDLENPVMIGILVNGQTDYVNRGGCRVANQVCDGGACGTEGISYAFHAAAHVDRNGGPEPTQAPPSNGASIQCGQTVSGSTRNRASTLGNRAGDMVYTFRAGEAIEASFDLCSADYDSYLRLYDASGSEIASNDDHGGRCGGLNRLASHMTTPLTPGQEYRILVEGYASNTGSFSLSVTCTQPDTPDGGNDEMVPPEGCSCVRVQHPSWGVIDRCMQPEGTSTPFCYVEGSCSSQPSGTVQGRRWANCVANDGSGSEGGSLQCGSSVSGSTRGRDSELGNISGEMTYEFTPTTATSVTFDLCDSEFDTYLRIFDDVGSEIARNDDHRGACGAGNSVASHVETFVRAHRTYTVVVEGFRSAEGNFQLDVTCGSGGSGDGDRPDSITCGRTVRGSTEGRSSIVGSSSGEALFEFTATEREYEFDACLSNYDSLLRVYQGAASDLPNARQVATNDDHGGRCSGSNRYASHLIVRTTIGQMYTLVVEGFSNEEGDFVLTTSC